MNNTDIAYEILTVAVDEIRSREVLSQADMHALFDLVEDFCSHQIEKREATPAELAHRATRAWDWID